MRARLVRWSSWRPRPRTRAVAWIVACCVAYATAACCVALRGDDRGFDGLVIACLAALVVAGLCLYGAGRALLEDEGRL